LKYTRLFTFGCSFTSFLWPTWADIIAYDLDIPYENWGMAGMGNVGIATRMLECDLKNNFTENDLILVCWSSFHREDRVMSDGFWHLGGNIFNDYKFFGKKWLKKYWTENNDIVKNCTAIISSNKMFNIPFQSYMTDYEGAAFQEDPSSPNYNFQEYDYYLNSMPDPRIVFDDGRINKTGFDKTVIDNHPDIQTHLTHSQLTLKHMGMEIKNETILKYKGLQNRITDDIKKKSLNGVLTSFNEIDDFFRVYNWEGT